MTIDTVTIGRAQLVDLVNIARQITRTVDPRST